MSILGPRSPEMYGRDSIKLNIEPCECRAAVGGTHRKAGIRREGTIGDQSEGHFSGLYNPGRLAFSAAKHRSCDLLCGLSRCDVGGVDDLCFIVQPGAGCVSVWFQIREAKR